MSKKVLVSLVVIIVIIVGLGIWANKSMWLFTNAYSQRSVAQSFFSDINKGKNKDAYSLTSTDYQKHNSYAGFESAFDQLNGNLSKVSYSSYSSTKENTVIVGTTSNKAATVTTRFGLDFVNQGGKTKIDTAVVAVSHN